MEGGNVYSFGRGDSAQLGLPADLIEQIKIVTEEDATFKVAVDKPTLFLAYLVLLVAFGKGYTGGFGESYTLGNKAGEDEQVPCQITGRKKRGAPCSSRLCWSTAFNDPRQQVASSDSL